MHKALYTQEILFNIFGHCSPPSDVRRSEFFYWHCNTADLAVLARTCRTFKEPALDVLWEELYDLSPLIRCLPEVCRSESASCYSLSRPLNEAEWNILRGHTRRVWSIQGFSTLSGCLDRDTIRVVLALTPSAGPLFPNLRSLFWQDSLTLPVLNAAVPSLTSFCLDFISFPDALPEPMKIFDTIGNHCPNMKTLQVGSYCLGPLDLAVSRQVSRWNNLQSLECHAVTLSMGTILHLPSASILRWLSFTLSADTNTTYLGPVLIFANLAHLEIDSTSLESITGLFARIQIPVIEDLSVSFSNKPSKQSVGAYWTTVQKTHPSNSLTNLVFIGALRGFHTLPPLYGPKPPSLTLDDLLPYKVFGDLCTIHINLEWSVDLTDADLLDVVSTSPCLEKLIVNDGWGWRMDYHSNGITLTGLVQLLRQCPLLNNVGLVIDTQTYTRIPKGLDVTFPPRHPFSINFLDSYISPSLISGLVLVFRTLKLHSCKFSAWTGMDPGSIACGLWERVREEVGGET